MCGRRLGVALIVLTTLFLSHQVRAQEKSQTGRDEFYAGYGLLSNSFNTYSEFSGSPLNGWHVALNGPVYRSLGITVCGLGFYGMNLGASQFEHTVLAGPQWSRHRARESFFAHGMLGVGHINTGAIPFDNSRPKMNFSLATMAGGGLDTSLSRSLAWRLEGDYLRLQYSSASNQIHNLAGNFAHFSTGLVMRF